MFGKQNLIFNFFLLSLAWCKSSTDASNLRYPGEDFSKADLQLAENDLDATKPLASVSGYIHQLLGDLKAIKMPTGSDGFAKSEHGLPEDVMMALNRLSEITDTDDEAEALLLFEELPKALEAMANYAENASGLDEEVAFSFASIAKGLRNAKQATDVAARNVPKLFNALPANTKKENIPTPTTTATFAEPAQVARKMVEVDFNGNTRNSGEGHSSSRRRRTSSSNSRFRSDPYAQYRNQHPRFKHHYDLQDAMLNGDHRFLTEHLTKMQHHAGQHTNPATGRKLFNNDFESLESQCSLLYDCVKLMSFYDLIVYFYADNIDFDTGDLDDVENIVRFDDTDLFGKAFSIANALKALQDSGDFNDETQCNALLSEFHRVDEFGDAFKWVGGIVTEVCLASGTTEYVKVEEIHNKLGADYSHYVFLDAMYCTRELFNSNDRTSDAEYSSDEFIFETTVGTTSGVLRIPKLFRDDTDGGNRNEHGRLNNNGRNPADVFEFYTFDDSEYLLNNARQGDCVDVNGALSLLCIEDNKESTSEFVKKAVDEFIDQILDQIFGGSIGCALFGWIFQQECDGDREDIDPGLLEGRYYDVALEMVFGEKPSVGKICGIAESVIDSTTPTTIPGYCCLDTPAESDAALGGVWGQPYKCEHECQNKGPYLSGMTVETCDIYGGQWCQNPVDCSQLQECVAVYLQDAIDNDRTAWATYLESSPSIKDPLDSFECGRAREYFGFEATFINDRQICQDIGQLRNTNDFAILEGFFAGSDGDGDGPDFSLTPPQTPEETTGFSAEGGLAWRASNFALSQAADLTNGLVQALYIVECPCTLGVNEVCVATKGGIVTAINIIFLLIQVALAISEFVYGEKVALSTYNEVETYLNTVPIFENMETTINYLAESMCGRNPPSLSSSFNYEFEKFTTTCELMFEVLCRPVPTLLKGHGCDGVDSNCDSDRFPDECAEDKYPPEFRLSRFAEFCGADKHVFPTEALALDCIQQHVEATDDCYGVSTVITPTTADASLSVCGTTKTFQIVATEDHCSKETTTSVNVLVDSSIQAEQGVCEFSKGPDFPPEVDVSKAKQNCGSVFFASASEAEKCILENVVATDDCRQVDIALASSLVVENDVTDLSICTPTYKVDITASIAGCDELFSTETIFVLVDSNIPPPLCSFDKGPDVAPILDITRAIDQCAGKIFSTIDDAKACVLKNGEAEDAAGSCRPIATAVEATGVVGCLSDIRVTATIPGPCSTEASLTTISDPIQVIIDNERPIVTCSFVDGIAKTGSGVQVDSEFTYDVSENCPFDVSVKVAMYSNEFEDFNSQSMVLQYEKQEDSFGNAKVGFFAASTICTTKSNGQCITDPMEAGRRFYRATVTATDQAGLTGSETCWVEVSGGSTGDAAPGKSQQAFLLSTYFDSAYSATYDPKIFV